MKGILSLLIVSCGLFAFAQTTVLDTMTINGLQRDFLLYVPEVYTGTTAVPLVINMHGYGSNASEQNLYGNFKNLADVDNFLVVHPNGTLDNTNTRYWNAFLNAGAVDDVDFISQLIDSLSLSYNIDPNKVFATGMSNGGFMSYKLACELNNKIAKIASVTGTMSTTLPSTCSPGSAIPVLQIHGTLDPTVPYAGNLAMESIEDVIDFWVANNNCNTTPELTALPNLNTADNSTVEKYEYTGGTDNADVIFYKVIGGGHTWPGAIFSIPAGNTNRDFNASQVIWEFFKDEAFVSIRENENIQNLSFQVINESIILHLKPNQKNLHVQLFNALGQVIFQTQERQFSILELQAGIYFIKATSSEGVFSGSFLK